LVCLLGTCIASWAWACGTSSAPSACAPSTPISGGGTIVVTRADGAASYGVSTSQVEDFINSGSLTITAAEADAGTGSLGATDPVVAVHMDPAPDAPGSYTLASLHAKVLFCPSAAAKFVVSNGTITGCAPSGSPVSEPIAGTLTVKSTQNKSIDANGESGGHVSLEAQYGAQDQTCTPQS
jgi:hypothetical protein